MPLKGLDYLVTALSGTVLGLSLVYGGMPAFLRKIPDADDYCFIVLMALSALCFWCSVKFIVINRRQSDALPLLIVLVPIILTSICVMWLYVSHVLELYAILYR